MIDRYKASEKLLKAIIALEQSEDFRVVLTELLASNLEDATNTALFHIQPDVRERASGEARCLTMLLNTITTAREELSKRN